MSLQLWPPPPHPTPPMQMLRSGGGSMSRLRQGCRARSHGWRARWQSCRRRWAAQWRRQAGEGSAWVQAAVPPRQAGRQGVEPATGHPAVRSAAFAGRGEVDGAARGRRSWQPLHPQQELAETLVSLSHPCSPRRVCTFPLSRPSSPCPNVQAQADGAVVAADNARLMQQHQAALQQLRAPLCLATLCCPPCLARLACWEAGI